MWITDIHYAWLCTSTISINLGLFFLLSLSHTETRSVSFLYCPAPLTTCPGFSFLSLSVLGHGGISCLQQEQKVAQDERCFLCWHTQHVPAGPDRQRKCCGGVVKLPLIYAACFLANNSYCTSVCLRSKPAVCCWLAVVHLQFVWFLLG